MHGEFSEMADLCLIHAKEDVILASELVKLLRMHWDIWWDEDIAHGDWENQIYTAIGNSKGVVALLTKTAAQKSIFKDEARYAHEQNIPIFPFAIESEKMPLGLRSLNRTDAFGWRGEAAHPGFQSLIKKIRKEMGGLAMKRKDTLTINGKVLKLPSFVCSLSSYETQISPIDGLQLFMVLKQPQAALVSAYDAWTHREDRKFLSMAKRLGSSPCVCFMDSGNYEADRKRDRKRGGKKNPNPDGWERKKYIEMARLLSPDIAFAYDNTDPKGNVDEIAERIVADARSDQKSISPLTFPICPIVHVPKDKAKQSDSKLAPELVMKVAKALDPVMIAIPERELGDGIFERAKAVRDIRKSLNTIGKYYQLHLLGTGNPLSIVALAAAGADSFDGLEWCRTAGDWETGAMYHFQHFDFFLELYKGRIADSSVRSLLESKDTPYALKVACLNIEIFNDLAAELQSMIHSGQVDLMMKRILPHAGKRLHEELKK